MVQQTRRAVQPQGLPVQAPHTLPFLGELLWPTLNQRILRDLYYWQATSDMGPDFPVGTVVALKRITSRQQLTLGRVYLFEYTVCAGTPAEQRQQRVGQLIKLAYGRMWLTQDESTEAAGCWLAWQDADFALYEVTHYVTLGTGSHLLQKTRRRGERTHMQAAQYEAQLFNGVGVRLQVTDGKRRVYRAWVALPTVQAVAKLVCRQQGTTPLPFVTVQEGGQAA